MNQQLESEIHEAFSRAVAGLPTEAGDRSAPSTTTLGPAVSRPV